VGRLLLAVALLAASLAAVRMLVLPAGQLAWGLGCAAPQPVQLQLTAVDLAAGTPTHGRLVKRGPQSSLEALAQGGDMLELSYIPNGSWPAQRLAGSQPPFPSKWCAAMFNDKYKLIYLKCPKTASTSLVGCLPDQSVGGYRVAALYLLTTPRILDPSPSICPTHLHRSTTLAIASLIRATPAWILYATTTCRRCSMS